MLAEQAVSGAAASGRFGTGKAGIQLADLSDALRKKLIEIGVSREGIEKFERAPRSFLAFDLLQPAVLSWNQLMDQVAGDTHSALLKKYGLPISDVTNLTKEVWIVGEMRGSGFEFPDDIFDVQPRPSELAGQFIDHVRGAGSVPKDGKDGFLRAWGSVLGKVAEGDSAPIHDLVPGERSAE